ncbi:uncharacterized protein LOC141856351 [Brevipalpus obovatus]|uniref:uncharacterized protein LOC141856052 n=1 Tax=Brevipalpus obovatus TaxID=246614 RepID=UPI003D9F47D0
MVSKIFNPIISIVLLSPIVLGTPVDDSATEARVKFMKVFCNTLNSTITVIIPSILVQKSTVEGCIKKLSGTDKCSKIKFIGSSPAEIADQANCKKNADLYIQMATCWNSFGDEKQIKVCNSMGVMAHLLEINKIAWGMNKKSI